MWELTALYDAATIGGEVEARRVHGHETYYDLEQYGTRFPQEHLCKPKRTWLRNFTEVETL